MWQGLPGESESTQPEEVSGPEIAEEMPGARVPSAAKPAEVPRPWFFSLLRLLFPLIFLAIPFLNFLLRNSPVRTQPVLHRAVLCEGIQQGLPVKPRTIFSIRENRQVVLFSQWERRPERQTLRVRWYAPSGNLQRTGAPGMQFLSGGEERFTAFALLPLEEGLPLGQWRAEVSVAEEVAVRLRFELRE